MNIVGKIYPEMKSHSTSPCTIWYAASLTTGGNKRS
jgi:hypothetical protein